MALPSLVNVPKVYGASQSGPTFWSPYGPQEQNLIISVIGDFQQMFNAFTAGKIDISDWPVFPGNLSPQCSGAGCFCSSTANPDYFCTTATNELGMFEEDINAANPFMGVPMTASRSTGGYAVPSVTTGANSTACSLGFGSLTITLINNENVSTTTPTYNGLVRDAYNGLTLSVGSPSPVTVGDSGGTKTAFPGGPSTGTPNGVYNSGCTLAGTYTLGSTIYGGLPGQSSVQIHVLSNTNSPITLKLDYNSVSGTIPTAASYYVGAATHHLLEVPNFVSGFFGPAATSNDAFAPGNNLGINSIATAQQLTAADCFLNGVVGSTDLHPWDTACSNFGTGPLETAAYLVTPSSVSGGSLWWQVQGARFQPGVGYAGHDDIRAACDDFVAMGFSLNVIGGVTVTCNDVANALSSGTTGPVGSTGGVTWTTSNYPHVIAPSGQHIITWDRASQGRGQFSTIVSDSLDAIFGTPSVSGGGVVCYGLCPNPTPVYYTFAQVTPYLFDDGPVSVGGSGPSNWNIYSGGYTLSSTPDYNYALFDSLFSGGTVCATGSAVANSPSPGNYRFDCTPLLDNDFQAGEFGTSTTFGPLFIRGQIEMLSRALEVPVWTGVDTFVENNGWSFQQCTGSTCQNTQSSIVNTLGLGTEGPFFTLLNARQVPGYIPSSTVNTPGGGNPNLIRYGFSQTTSQLSLYQYVSVWEANMIGEIYDSMLAVNPLTFTSAGQLMDWQTTKHTTNFNPTQTCISPGTGLVTGCTTQTWFLRNDIKFQDGNKVTANDVAYSILSDRDVPSSNLGSTVANVASAVGLNCGTGQPCNQLQVVLASQSPFYEADIGGIPITEAALWAPYCGPVTTINASPFENGIPSSPTSVCAGLSFDPTSANNPLTNKPGILIGDGPFACVEPNQLPTVPPTPAPNPGLVGGGCTFNSDGTISGQAVGVSGSIALSRSTPAGWTYYRCCPNSNGLSPISDTSTSLYQISYAQGDPVAHTVSHSEGIDNILSLASVAACYNGTSSLCPTATFNYWNNPAITGGASGPLLVPLATVAFYFGAGTVEYGGQNSVFGSMTGIDPQVDPFFCPTTGCP